MMQTNKINYYKITTLIFIFLSLIPFILQFIKIDIPMNVVNFSFIVLCFIYTLLTLNKSKHNLLQLGAITFTLIADYFLTLNDSYYTLSVLIFTVVQVFYFIRILSYSSINEIKFNILIRIIIIYISTLIILVFFKEYLNDLIAVALFYYINFFINLIFSFIHFKENKLLALGLLLFILCDTFIGLTEMVYIFNFQESSFIYNITHTGYNISWIFYIPAQTLLAISKNG